jgi:O-antigen/teichoic acid export membrane protein
VAISQGCRFAISFVSISIFARLLPTADFGLMAMATVATNFASIFSNMGTTAALIQKDELTDGLRNTVFWLNIVFGLATGGLVALGSPLIAWAFDDPALQSVLLCLSIAFPLGSAGASASALLERSGQFRSIAIAETSSAIAGAAVGIAVAADGGGILGLIVMTLVTTALSTSLFLVLCSWRPTLRWGRKEFQKEVQGLLHFSGNLVGFNIIDYFASNADGMLIGRFLGSFDLGLYNIAYRTVLQPMQNLTYVTHRALFPIFSARQTDVVLIGKNYLKLQTFISLVTAPLMFGLWSVREPFVAVVLGEKWHGATAVVAWLAPTAYLQSLASTVALVLLATGRSRLLRNLGAVSGPIYLIFFALGLSQGVAGVARGYFFADLIKTTIYLHYTLVQVDLKLIDVARSICRPLAAALIMAALVFAADHSITPAGTPVVLRLAYLVTFGASSYAILLAIIAPGLLGETRRLLLQRNS